MEPVEAVRMLGTYGNPSTTTIVNTRAIQAVDITGMGAKYPEIDGLLADIRALSGRVLRINATEEAKKLGNALMANVVILGVIAGANVVPLERSTLEPIIKERFPKAFEKNMAAFDRGVQLANG
jgi:indolepyruvate ferredoxin oxidoreductase beta subunit